MIYGRFVDTIYRLAMLALYMRCLLQVILRIVVFGGRLFITRRISRQRCVIASRTASATAFSSPHRWRWRVQGAKLRADIFD